MAKEFERRKFIKGMAAIGATLLAAESAGASPLRYFKPVNIDNPLAQYPDRNWEKVYRNIFKPDSSFVFLCAPNDTHNCLLKTYVKNGIAVRIGPTYGYGKAEDLYGNKSSHRWDPRLCQKGLGLVRRFYADRRIKCPMIRRGFKQWIDDGFPRDPITGAVNPKYLQRGKDRWLRLSWDDAYKYSAKAHVNIANTYSGEEGAKKLLAQGYDPLMVEEMQGSGTQTLKYRGGMALLGLTRLFGNYRFANSLALMDAKIRNVDAEHAHSARGLDSYTWHTDLPPGHPMVTGSQTNDFDLSSVEHANLVIVWGMNWISTKMPDSHWLTEARLKGTKIISVTLEYSSTANKSDEVFMIRPASDPAFALGLSQVIISKKLFDYNFVSKNTDLPFLIRVDTLQPLRPEEYIKGYKNEIPKNLNVLKNGEKPPANYAQKESYISENLADEFKPYMIADSKGSLHSVTRDEWGKNFEKKNINPDLRFNGKIKLIDGTEVKVRTVFDLMEEYLNENFTPEKTQQVTGCDSKAIISLAEQIAKNPEKTLIACGMGPNQFFNADLKDRAIFFLGALTRNIGFIGGNVGSYAGNYKASLISGEPLYVLEDPFNLQLDPKGKVKTKKYMHYDSIHFFNYGDRLLKAGKNNLTGKTHMPVPTKGYWQANSNSSLGNSKWHYDLVNNTLPKVEMLTYLDYWWTASCEYSDIVFAVDSPVEFKVPDMTASCTNSFVQIHPITPLPRIFDTQPDIKVIAGVAKAIGEEIGESRLYDCFKFVHEDNIQTYLQRIIDGSSSLKGYDIDVLHDKCKQGIPSLLNNRTYPRASSYEQSTKQEKPWDTKSGRLEFYRPETEFIDSGENMIIYREPIDSTHHEPNVIVASSHEAIRPKTPESYGVDSDDLSCEARQTRHVLRTPQELVKSHHPLKSKGFTHVYHTPKYRHGTHTTPIDTDFVSVWFGPFGDVYRHDKRMPAFVEGYVDINPLDARELGLDDGDYVYIDADPEDRPYRGWKEGTEDYKVGRLMLRIRFYPGTPRGIARTWYNMYGASHGSVKGQESRKDGLAKNPDTNYQSMFRYGSHQSATRAWLKPTWLTDSLVHRNLFGQTIDKGGEAEVHFAIGAPREAFVKITKAEAGGFNGKGKWRPAALGFRPTYESNAMKIYLKGQYIKIKK